MIAAIACSEPAKEKENELERNSIFDDFLPSPQKFYITGAADTTITGEKGTIIFIPKNSFKTNNDNNDIEVTLIEYYDKSDMLMEGLTTLTEDGKLLISGGIIYLSLNSGSETLKINNGKKLSIYFNKNYNKRSLEMRPFHGHPNSREPGSGEVLGWVLAEEGLIEEIDSIIYKITLDNGQVMTSDIAEIDNHYFRTKNLQWINMSYVFKNKNVTDVAIELSSSLPMAIRMVVLEKNIIIPGFLETDGNYHFSNAPIGEKVALLVFSKVNDKYFLASKRVKIKNNHPVEKLTLRVVSFDELKEELKSYSTK